MASTLVINPGSSSRKYALFVDARVVLELRFESTDNGFEVCTNINGTKQICEPVTKREFTDSFDRVKTEVNEYLHRNSPGCKLDKIVVRIVAPGTFFQQHRLIDDAFVAELESRKTFSPLHIPIILREISNARKGFKNQRIVAASDSAFHATMPPRARNYSIHRADVAEYDLHRFGYHGLSVASILRRIHPLIGIDPERLVVCHVGNGASVTAVKNGKSIDTTMGFSPATGVVMSSRGGDVDTAALLELMRVKHWRPIDAQMYLNSKCGLAGLAGDADIRRLLDRRAQHDEEAVQALDVFAYHLQRAIAAQAVALGGLDVLVLTATAAVRSSALREIILSGLSPLGVEISRERNEVLVSKEGVISVRNSAVKVVVMRTDEMGEMAYVADLLT